MMGGIMLTSITSGRLISKIGKYRIFPIIGTLLAFVAMGLLARSKTTRRCGCCTSTLLCLAWGWVW